MFVAINYISCTIDYKNRFEELIATRVKAVDQMPGFIKIQVLKPLNVNDDYLIISYWDSENYFMDWSKSDAFKDGHKRGFADIAGAKNEGKTVPLKSCLIMYKMISE